MRQATITIAGACAVWLLCGCAVVEKMTAAQFEQYERHYEQVSEVAKENGAEVSLTVTGSTEDPALIEGIRLPVDVVGTITARTDPAKAALLKVLVETLEWQRSVIDELLARKPPAYEDE